MNVTTTANGNTSRFSSNCEWAGLRQTCYNGDPDYIEETIYNEQGDVLISSIDALHYRRNTRMDYDCP